MDKKRIHFPRFFFISNDELLEILSETKDPIRIQIYLTKCFSGIAQLDFTENFSIKTIQSLEGEAIDLCNSVVTANSRGQVEKWLLELEIEMRNTIKQSIETTLIAAEESWDGLMENIWKYPGQSIHTVICLHWTQKITEIIGKSGNWKEFQSIEEKVFDSLMKLSKAEDLHLKDRINLNGLLILKLQQIEVTKHLQDGNVTSLSNFTWISQLRHEMHGDNLVVRIMSSSLNYGYEYLGNVKRLVQTPQTERCYRTLFLAINYHLGGHLTGPAGAGKSELIKDFAKCLAKHLVIFNCSDKTPKSVIASFFKVSTFRPKTHLLIKLRCREWLQVVPGVV